LLTGVQVRAARAMLRWDAAQLAIAAGVSEADIAFIEAHDGAPPPSAIDLAAIVRAFEEGGVVFLDGGAPGVQLRPLAEGMRPEQLNAENDG
jgi:transcriptional regulator with XRE-family HTH domain